MTQVALGTPDMSLHNRLVHSLKVEQVGLSLVSRLAQRYTEPSIDQYAVMAACLGHDIGHPPFGHAGETALQELLVCRTHRTQLRNITQRRDDPCPDCTLEDGFEGNAQTFRILAVLGVHRSSPQQPFGLDLTRITLAAASKYPWTRGADGKKARKWGAYDCDSEILEWVFGNAANSPSIEAQVMDWADDISYAVHDIEDFFRVGLIPIDGYEKSGRRLETFLEYVQDVDVLGALDTVTIDAFKELTELFPSARFDGTTEDLAKLDNLRSTLLSKFIEAASLDHSDLKLDEKLAAVNAVLKQLIWYHIIDEPKLANIQAGQQRVLRDIYEDVLDVAISVYGTSGGGRRQEKQLRRLPQGLRRSVALSLDHQPQQSRYSLRQKIVRGVVDYISSLSDAEAYTLHATLRGRETFGHL